MATIATFFSSVTATTLQYSYSQTSASEELWAYVNAVWFSSLVFSIASAANSFLGVALYQRPEYFGHSSLSEYRCIRIWFDKCPMFFLIISGGLFGIGLCLFAISSGQVGFDVSLSILNSPNYKIHSISPLGLLHASYYDSSRRSAYHLHRDHICHGVCASRAPVRAHNISRFLPKLVGRGLDPKVSENRFNFNDLALIYSSSTGNKFDF